jgi:hypothetical protein
VAARRGERGGGGEGGWLRRSELVREEAEGLCRLACHAEPPYVYVQSLLHALHCEQAGKQASSERAGPHCEHCGPACDQAFTASSKQASTASNGPVARS